MLRLKGKVRESNRKIKSRSKREEEEEEEEDKR